MNEVKPLNSALSGAAKPAARTTLAANSSTEGKDLPEVAGSGRVQEVVDAAATEVADARENVEAAVAKLNDYIQSTKRDLKFEVDEDSGRTVITVFDSATQEVIRQIPPDVVKDLAQKLNGEEPLRLFSARA